MERFSAVLALLFSSHLLTFVFMRSVEQMEADMAKLSHEELREIRSWLDDFLEDELEFTDEFEAAIRGSEAEMSSAVRPRTRTPGSEKA